VPGVRLSARSEQPRRFRWRPRPYRRTLLRLIKRAVGALLAAQAGVISTLMAIDVWRKRYRSQGAFPRIQPGAETVAGSEVQVYTYGEDLYAVMLDAIEQAESGGRSTRSTYAHMPAITAR
jgi:hypothetical protein